MNALNDDITVEVCLKCKKTKAEHHLETNGCSFPIFMPFHAGGVVVHDTPKPAGRFIATAREIGELVEKKNQAYGDSFAKSGDFLRLLYPGGMRPEQYNDALTLVRIFDKQMRIATAKDALGENPWIDITGYSLLATVRRDEAPEEAGSTPEERCPGCTVLMTAPHLKLCRFLSSSLLETWGANALSDVVSRAIDASTDFHPVHFDFNDVRVFVCGQAESVREIIERYFRDQKDGKKASYPPRERLLHCGAEEQ